MSTRFVNPITYKYLLISTNIVQLFDFVDFALRVKKLHIILIFFTFYDTFLCISISLGKFELRSVQKSPKNELLN